jgi:hypothetical protein
MKSHCNWKKDSRDNNKDKQQLVFLGIGEAENSGRMQAPFEAFYQTLRDNYTDIKLSTNREKILIMWDQRIQISSSVSTTTFKTDNLQTS